MNKQKQSVQFPKYRHVFNTQFSVKNIFLSFKENYHQQSAKVTQKKPKNI